MEIMELTTIKEKDIVELKEVHDIVEKSTYIDIFFRSGEHSRVTRNHVFLDDGFVPIVSEDLVEGDFIYIDKRLIERI